MRIPELVRTYKLLSQPDGPPFSLKFAGAVLGVLVVGGGVLYWASTAHEPGVAPNQFALSSTPNADGSKTDYVGYLPSTFNAKLGFEPERVEEALAAWEATHSDAEIVSKEPRWVGGHVVGYEIRYR